MYIINIQGLFEKHIRRTVLRYVNLSTVLVFRLIAAKVDRRFPTLQSLVDAKLLLPREVTHVYNIKFITVTWGFFSIHT